MWKLSVSVAFLVLFLLSLTFLVRIGPSGIQEYAEISFEDLENWSSDQQGLAFTAYKKSCAVFLSRPAIKKIRPEKIGGTVGDWHPSCRQAQQLGSLTDAEARQFFEQHFTVLAYGQQSDGLFTGYFAPEYDGSERQTAHYNTPLFAVPEDLKTVDLGKFSVSLKGKSITGQIKDGEFIPYKDRKLIDNGALDSQKLELVWLKDPVDAFFMHIQGSGIIRFENGDRRLFGYAGKNGKAYHSIGKFLIQSGDIKKEDMSMQAIRQWITNNPAQGRDLMWKNPSYVFFQQRTEQAPVGTMNVELTAGRSLAVDREYIPLGMPVWLDLKPSSEQGDPLRRLVIAQDTGGAIKGRVRADVYWGIGEDAGMIAGSMKDRGRYYFLLPKGLARRVLLQAESEISEMSGLGGGSQ